MKRPAVAVICGANLAAYHFGEQHPFGPYRHQAFVEGLQQQDLMAQIDCLDPVRCEKEHLHLFHTPDYVQTVEQACNTGEGYLDQGDTPARKGIYEAACYVVGSVLKAIDLIMNGTYLRGFIPIAGLHHAYRDHSSGFCVFNDCAIAIEHLRNQHAMRKILYVDIDAHHGDGVLYNYESDPDLFIVDFHEDGRFIFPGTGDADETGTGPARGSKRNYPLPMYADDDQFAKHWVEAEAFIDRVKPEFIILQCGADSMKGDPITHLEFSTQSYQLAARSLCRLADKYCQGRMIGLGGGGYNLNNIRQAWPTIVAEFNRPGN